MKPVKENKDIKDLKALIEAYEEQRCEIEDTLTKINNTIADMNSSIENINITINEINDLTERKNIDLHVDEIETVDEVYVDIATVEYDA